MVLITKIESMFRWTALIVLLFLFSGCIDSDVIDIPSDELPPATDDLDIPITTNFEECAKYYPVMESWPMQCRDPVADRTFTQVLDEPECEDGDVITSICPDDVTSYQDQNCVDGEWHQVMYVRNPCEIV